MKELSSRVEHLLILGAGASVDYGLPTWDKLVILIEKKFMEDKALKYKEEILSWLRKVGDGKEYNTIDECITKESRSRNYRSNGLTIENYIFLIMKIIFTELYKENEDGWINKLNQKILDSNNLENKIAFINYNYDNVLDKNILLFEYLTEKERKVDYRSRIANLSAYVQTFYPHGNFYSEQESQSANRLYRHLKTKKSELQDVIDAISCHESEKHVLKMYGTKKLYILGLGNGLQINLDNIEFTPYSISEIHVTIKNKDKKDYIIDFLNKKFGIPAVEIKIYDNCDELIEKCFN